MISSIGGSIIDITLIRKVRSGRLYSRRRKGEVLISVCGVTSRFVQCFQFSKVASVQTYHVVVLLNKRVRRNLFLDIGARANAWIVHKSAYMISVLFSKLMFETYLKH